MTLSCVQCGYGVENPYHSLSAFLFDKKNERIAFSNMEQSICSGDFNRKLSNEVKYNPSDICSKIGYASTMMLGEYGGHLGQNIQISGNTSHSGNFKYFEIESVSKRMPKAAKMFAGGVKKWMELKKAEWVDADWATPIYNRIKSKYPLYTRK